MRKGLGRLGVVVIAITMVSACTASDEPPAPLRDTAGPDAVFIDAGSGGVTVTPGDDWTLPAWVRPAPQSGFFSEEAAPDDRVFVRSVDLTWRQVQPRPGQLDREARGEAQGMAFGSWTEQLGTAAQPVPGEFWMRLFASGVEWAPPWVVDDCAVRSYGPDYDGMEHLPIWNECVWGHLLDTYRRVFVDEGLAADPRLRFVYVPGAFTWAEYDYEMVQAAVDAGDLDLAQYRAWYDHAWTDLVTIFGAHSTKLVFTGEDFPFGPFGTDDDDFAQRAVDAGMGIRTGITELSNFHLSEAPAYGSAIQPDGHLVVDESRRVHDGSFVVATENECYTDCGYVTDDPYYAVRQSNLKALQLRMNWIYVVPGPSYFAEFAEHWDWVRLSIGQTAVTSADAWAALRDAEDRYWVAAAQAGELGRFEDPAAWPQRPWVRNLERWLVQRDEPGSIAHRTEADVHSEVFEPDNGIAAEGLSTDVAAGDTGFVFEVDSRFAEASAASKLVLKVTFLDSGVGTFRIVTAAGVSAPVTRADTGEWVTATIALPSEALAEGTRLRIALDEGSDDLVVRFVRLVRLAQTRTTAE